MNLFLKILIIISIFLIAFGIAYYFLRKKATKLQTQQQTLINEHRMTVSMFVIDKKKTKLKAGTFPTKIMDQFPKYYKWKKLPLVKGRVNGKIMTFICDEKIFQKLPTGKILKVDIAGLYIVDAKFHK